jgi:hypothetical protein
VDVVKNLHLTLVPLGIVLMVAGCGGGGGSSSSPGSTPTANVKITTTNSTKFASGAVSSTNQVTGSASTGNTQVGLKSIAQSATANSLNAANIAATQFNKVLNLPLSLTSSARSTKATASNSVTLDCTTSLQVTPPSANSLTLTINKAGANWAANDSFILSYNACISTGVTFNGSMTYAITSMVVGTSAAYKTTFATFTATDGVNILTMNGDMTNSASLSAAGVLTSSISGNSFTISVDADSFTMNAYSETFTYNKSNAAYSYAINMSLVLSGIGTVDITTSPAFSGVSPNNPTSGVMTISGTNGTYVSVTATSDPLNATLKVNDGTNPLATSQVPWANL